ncbi:MAG: hypothetical protein PHH41_04460 [Sulfurimonas sp.]|nr:hypothetical protein [Sulfurimonas sp.]MDD5202373.1 hypothetical protein [Sulfurimonas sp.]
MGNKDIYKTSNMYKDCQSKYIVYLDQNVLSDLRDRKLFETKNKNLMMLKSILMRPDIEVVFSHVIVDEISQINNDDFFLEHYHVLDQLGAKFIDPISKKIINEEAHKAALTYLKNKKISFNTSYPYVEKILEELSRKISGLKVDKTFDGIEKDLKKNLDYIGNDAIEQLNNLNENDYEEPIKSALIDMKANMPILLKESIPASNLFPQLYNMPLGTKPYREHELTKKLMDSNPTSSELVIELEKRWQKESHIFSSNLVSNSLVESKIFYAYTQLNWLGYYADDFDKDKKNKDRFNASQNDMRHLAYAYRADFLISKDEKLLKKAIVSYEFANVKIVVGTPEYFLSVLKI